jgi:hypothetical protein
LEYLGLDGRMTLKQTFKEYDASVDWIDLAQGTKSNGSFEDGNESGSIRCGEFFD